jgi:hypothetical protein
VRFRKAPKPLNLRGFFLSLHILCKTRQVGRGAAQ